MAAHNGEDDMNEQIAAAERELAAAYAEFPKIGSDRGSILKAADRINAARWALYVLRGAA